MRVLFLLIFTVVFQTAMAQSTDYSKDVQSVDAIMAALYEVISGESITPRDC